MEKKRYIHEMETRINNKLVPFGIAITLISEIDSVGIAIATQDKSLKVHQFMNQREIEFLITQPTENSLSKGQVLDFTLKVIQCLSDENSKQVAKYFAENDYLNSLYEELIRKDLLE